MSRAGCIQTTGDPRRREWAPALSHPLGIVRRLGAKLAARPAITDVYPGSHGGVRGLGPCRSNALGETAVAPEVAAMQARPAGRFLNRELSWLDFDERILAVAQRKSLPVLERAKFFAIFSDNLDEFFQVRVGSLRMQLDAGLRAQDSEDENIRREAGQDQRPGSGARREARTRHSPISSCPIWPRPEFGSRTGRASMPTIESFSTICSTSSSSRSSPRWRSTRLIHSPTSRTCR